MAEMKQTDNPNKNKHQNQWADASPLPTKELLLNAGGFPGGADGEESACSAEDPGSIPGSGRSPGEGNGNPPQSDMTERQQQPVFLPGESHGQRSLLGYGPWSSKETDVTERLRVSLRFTHLVAYVRISSHFEGDTIPLYVHTMFCSAIHPSWTLVFVSLFGYCE